MTKTRKKPAETRQETGRKPASGNRQPAAKKAKAKGKPAQRERILTPWQKWTAKPDEAIRELAEFVGTNGVDGHLAAFCRLKGIKYPTLLDWINADEKRSEMYARAREDRADVIADEIVGIADEIEVEEVKGPDGEILGVRMDATAVARNRLRVDARKWVASKLKPKTYGEKSEISVTAAVTASVSYTANIPKRGA